jgi:hypothetical protein
MARKIIPLGLATNEVELRDWDCKTEEMRADLQSGRIAGIVSLVIYADGSSAIVTRGHLFRDRDDIAPALADLAAIRIDTARQAKQ